MEVLPKDCICTLSARKKTLFGNEGAWVSCLHMGTTITSLEPVHLILEELDLTVPKIRNCTRSNVMPTYSRGLIFHSRP
jgi:hypothetical protein